MRNLLVVVLGEKFSLGDEFKKELMDMNKSAHFELMDEDVLSKAADCLKVLAHPVRLDIVQRLLNKEYAVGELAEAVGVRQHVASEHLGLMKKCGFLSSRREGQKVFYEVSEDHLVSLMECLGRKFGN